MTHNRLYNLLNSRDSDFSFNSIQLKENNHKVPYFLCELALEGQLRLLGAQGTVLYLESHHLSFYKTTVDKKNSELSEYHYTAKLKDKQGNRYRIHVYFDHNDRLTKKPILAIMNNDHYDRITCDSDLHDSLENFALLHSMDKIIQLREQQEKVIHALEEKLHETQDTLVNLSVNLQMTHQEYLAKVSDAREILASLMRYSHLNYQSLDRILSHYQSLFENPASHLQVEHKDDSIEPETTRQAPIEDRETPKQAAPVIKESADQLIIAAQSAAALYEASKNKDDRKQLEIFLQGHSAINDSFMRVVNGDCLATLSQLQLLHSLHRQFNKHGIKLLTNLLCKNLFAEAEQMSSFFRLIPNKLFKMAIQAGNASLLDFLLRHHDLPIDTFIIRGKLNPVQFCFAMHSEEKSKLGVLSVLVKHGASVIVPAEDGLPIAHHIFYTQAHPLISVILEHPKGVISLSKIIISKLEALPHTGALDNVIKFYKVKIRDLHLNTGYQKIDQLQSKLTSKEYAEMDRHFDSPLRNDEEIRELAKQISEAGTTFFQQLPLSKRLSSNRRHREFINNLTQQLKSNPIGDNTADTRQETITLAQNCLKEQELKNKLGAIEDNMKKSRSRRAFNRLNRQRQAITEEIHALKKSRASLFDNTATNAEDASKQLRISRELGLTFSFSTANNDAALAEEKGNALTRPFKN